MTTIELPARVHTSDLDDVLEIHRILSDDAQRLPAAIAALQPLDRIRRIPMINEFFDLIVDQLMAHHFHDETVSRSVADAKEGGPAVALAHLIERSQDIDLAIRQLDHAFDELRCGSKDFAASKAAALVAAEDFVVTLRDHFDRDHSHDVPESLQGLTFADAAAKELLIQMTGTSSGIMFFVPWVLDRLPWDLRDEALREAPAVFRMAYDGNVVAYRELISALNPRR